jgi:hypothetical protein
MEYRARIAATHRSFLTYAEHGVDLAIKAQGNRRAKDERAVF